MRSSRSMIADGEQSRALVVQYHRGSVVVRNSDLAVIPPRPLPLTLKARRSVAKLTRFSILAALFAFSGYAYRDPDIRREVDYRITLLTAPGISDMTSNYANKPAGFEPLPPQARHLFDDSQKGPRADRFVYALKSGFDIVSRRMKADPLHMGSDPAVQSAALASAELFLTAFTPHNDPLLEAETPAPPRKPGGDWAGLLKNASLSPDQPQTLFGGLTEDEFRKRELRCMATAIYFEARDEPIKGQIAVAQVIMNRIRSPFYPKTVCGVVYQGERNRSGCQFSFTCTGKHNSVKEKPEWATAVQLAKQVIAGEVWIKEVGYATHYHATYVHPPWRFELDKVAQIGGHIFYKMKPGTVQVALLSEGL
ncbi:MAG: cell wall hydrolase [Rhodomicrobium sp.]